MSLTGKEREAIIGVSDSAFRLGRLAGLREAADALMEEASKAGTPAPAVDLATTVMAAIADKIRNPPAKTLASEIRAAELRQGIG